MRALVVSNMLPDAEHPERGRFVRDQVAALRELDELDVELHEFDPGPRALLRAAGELRRRFGAAPAARARRAPAFDVVHAHFGLTAWPSLALPARVHALTVHGTDVRHPRSRLVTAAALPLIDLLAAASQPLVSELPGRAARARARVLPCGVDLERFRAIPRAQARAALDLDPSAPYVLFAADPARAEKRHDRAVALAAAAGARLLTLGGVQPETVPLWVNAASAVLVTSEREGFGLAVLEALACEVPVLATPVGVHSEALDGLAGTLCAPFELRRWREALQARLHDPDPRLEGGRERASRFSARAMASRVADAWRETLARSAQRSG
ncbi:MAG TPA: glycosyltransferase [Solirubrobacteraceae bacterium]|nr:glycosyltransferase [Solirubrobacteraceae bacterium]